ncbi:MAG: hypothetical protein DLM61_08200 [Pseudonocardiales bacterium]|nr:MAG: hypothetical protein DLM61_08200 [Pseudonocardiales bacterium]
MYYALPYLLTFGLHMGAVLSLLGVFGGTVVVRTLMAAVLLLAALLLLLATPSGRRSHRTRRDGRRARSTGRDRHS